MSRLMTCQHLGRMALDSVPLFIATGLTLCKIHDLSEPNLLTKPVYNVFFNVLYSSLFQSEAFKFSSNMCQILDVNLENVSFSDYSSLSAKDHLANLQLVRHNLIFCIIFNPKGMKKV